MGLHDVAPGSHLVHFYADDRALAASIAEYVVGGLRSNQAAVLIVEPAHLAAVREALGACGVDADADARIQVLDSSSTLAAFMEDGRPGRKRFCEVVGGALRSASAGRAGVRAYGEMVETLWREGNVGGALALEELWNQLGRELPFTLYCAYRDALVAGSPGDRAEDPALDEACRLHSHVLADGRLGRRRSSTAHFAAAASAPAAARSFVLAQIEPDVAVDVADRAALAVSELATNAVRYGRGAFSVTVTPLSRAVRVAVRDDSPELPAPRPSTMADTTGRGLHIVGASCRAWGTEPAGDGKIVWAEIDRS